MTSFDLSLYLVLDPDLCRSHSMVETTMDAIAGGATIVQLRDKEAGTDGLIRAGRELMRAMEGTNVPLIVNDDIEAAIAIGAHGLHVGQDDLPSQIARDRLGPDKIIGLSIESLIAPLSIMSALARYSRPLPNPTTNPPSDLTGWKSWSGWSACHRSRLAGLSVIMCCQHLKAVRMALLLCQPFVDNRTPNRPPPISRKLLNLRAIV